MTVPQQASRAKRRDPFLDNVKFLVVALMPSPAPLWTKSGA
ncbi:hypothetical protein AB0C33_43025 [Nonomuraea sp. NPDC048881]